MKHSERDRHLPEDVARRSLPDHALDAVDASDHLDPTLEEAEQRLRITLMHGGLARNEPDVRDHPGKSVALVRLEVREHCYLTDLSGCHHEARALIVNAGWGASDSVPGAGLRSRYWMPIRSDGSIA